MSTIQQFRKAFAEFEGQVRAHNDAFNVVTKMSHGVSAAEWDRAHIAYSTSCAIVDKRRSEVIEIINEICSSQPSPVREITTSMLRPVLVEFAACIIGAINGDADNSDEAYAVELLGDMDTSVENAVYGINKLARSANGSDVEKAAEEVDRLERIMRATRDEIREANRRFEAVEMKLARARARLERAATTEAK